MAELPVSEKNAVIDTLTSRLNLGTANPTAAIRIYTAGGVATGTLLATATFSNPAFPAAAGGSATANAIARDDVADATGDAAVVVYLDRDRVLRLTGTITADGGGGDMTMPSTSVVAGEPFEISGAQYVM